MISYRSVIAAIGVILILPSCQPKETVAEPSVFTFAGSDKITAEPQQGSYTITCDQAVSVTSSEAWASVKSCEPKENNKYTLTVDYKMNDGDKDRTCEITAVSGSQKKIMTVTQQSLLNSGVISDSLLVFEGLNDSKNLAIITLANDWKMELTDTKSTPSWIAADKLSGGKGKTTVCFNTTEDNVSMSDRNCFAKIMVGSSFFYVTLTQKKSDAIIADSNKKEIGYEGGRFKVTIGHNTQFSVMIESDWIKRDTKSGSFDVLDHEDIYFIADENPDIEGRVGYISFLNGRTEERVTVYQGFTDKIILGEESMTIQPFGGSKKVDLRSNIEYEINVTGGGWLKAGLSEGRVDEITLTAEPNTTGTERAATIEVRGTVQTEVYDELQVVQMKYDPDSPFESKTFGIYSYGTKGEDVEYDRFADQTGTGASFFRIVSPSMDKFIEISDIPSGTLFPDQEFAVRVVQNRMVGFGNNVLRKVKVYKVDGDVVWLTDTEAVGYTIKHIGK